MRTTLLKTFCLLFGFSILSLGYLTAQLPGYVHMPQYQGNDTLGNSEEQELLIFYFPLTSSTLDITPFKNLLKDPLRIPEDSMEVILPDMKGVQDSVYALAWLSNTSWKKERLVPFIVSGFGGESPLFYLDKNLDNDFTNDGPPQQFAPGESRMKVKLQGEEKRDGKYVFYLLSPPKTKDYRREKYAEKWASLIDPLPVDESKDLEGTAKGKFGIRLGTFYGWGSLKYRYNNFNTGFPTWYHVSSTDKGLSASAVLRLLSWKFTLFGAYENLFFWSSTRTVRLGDPYVIDISGIGPVHFENIRVEINRDKLPSTRLTYGLGLEYGFPLGNIVELSPAVSAGMYQFTSGKYLSDIDKPELEFEIPIGLFVQYGIVLELRATAKASLLIGGQLQHNRYDFKGYFDQFNASSLEKQFQNARLSLAYQFMIF